MPGPLLCFSLDYYPLRSTAISSFALQFWEMMAGPSVPVLCSRIVWAAIRSFPVICVGLDSRPLLCIALLWAPIRVLKMMADRSFAVVSAAVASGRFPSIALTSVPLLRPLHWGNDGGHSVVVRSVPLLCFPLPCDALVSAALDSIAFRWAPVQCGLEDDAVPVPLLSYPLRSFPVDSAPLLSSRFPSGPMAVWKMTR